MNNYETRIKAVIKAIENINEDLTNEIKSYHDTQLLYRYNWDIGHYLGRAVSRLTISRTDLKCCIHADSENAYRPEKEPVHFTNENKPFNLDSCRASVEMLCEEITSIKDDLYNEVVHYMDNTLYMNYHYKVNDLFVVAHSALDTAHDLLKNFPENI